MSAMCNPTHSILIDTLGGTVEVARLCHVSSQAVSKWRREGIPAARLMFLCAVRPAELQRLDLCEKAATSSASQETA